MYLLDISNYIEARNVVIVVAKIYYLLVSAGTGVQILDDYM